jgi:hypothetical protein
MDGEVAEDAELDCEVTDNPVEYGANVVDNAYIKPTILNVTAYVTQTPAFTISPNGFFNQFKRTADAISVLRQLEVDRLLVDVTAQLGFFRNMMLKSFKPRVSNEGLSTVMIDMTFQELILVGETDSSNPFDPKYRSQVNRGKLQPGGSPI